MCFGPFSFSAILISKQKKPERYNLVIVKEINCLYFNRKLFWKSDHRYLTLSAIYSNRFFHHEGIFITLFLLKCGDGFPIPCNACHFSV